MANVAKGGDSALLELLDNADENDEVMNTSSQEPFEIKDETFIDMDQDTDQLLSSNIDEDSVKYSPFSLAYYVRLFDVDTDEVVSRLAWCMLPRPQFTSNFARKSIKSKPDLYGPFWICITLVFSVAIFGNVASYFQIQDKHWHYDFQSHCLSCYCLLVCIIDAIGDLWHLMEWHTQRITHQTLFYRAGLHFWLFLGSFCPCILTLANSNINAAMDSGSDLFPGIWRSFSPSTLAFDQ